MQNLPQKLAELLRFSHNQSYKWVLEGKFFQVLSLTVSITNCNREYLRLKNFCAFNHSEPTSSLVNCNVASEITEDERLQWKYKAQTKKSSRERPSTGIAHRSTEREAAVSLAEMRNSQAQTLAAFQHHLSTLEEHSMSVPKLRSRSLGTELIFSEVTGRSGERTFGGELGSGPKRPRRRP